jgi:hypothetical protein
VLYVSFGAQGLMLKKERCDQTTTLKLRL